MNKISLTIMLVFYAAAGINHFLHPQFYQKIMPSWLGWHDQLIFITGVLEILFALLLIFVSTRRIAAWGIIVLLVAVFPANIRMMVNYILENNPQIWLSVLRLPLQILLIWWAYGFTKPVTAKTQTK